MESGGRAHRQRRGRRERRNCAAQLRRRTHTAQDSKRGVATRGRRRRWKHLARLDGESEEEGRRVAQERAHEAAHEHARWEHANRIAARNSGRRHSDRSVFFLLFAFFCLLIFISFDRCTPIGSPRGGTRTSSPRGGGRTASARAGRTQLSRDFRRMHSGPAPPAMGEGAGSGEKTNTQTPQGRSHPWDALPASERRSLKSRQASGGGAAEQFAAVETDPLWGSPADYESRLDLLDGAVQVSFFLCTLASHSSVVGRASVLAVRLPPNQRCVVLTLGSLSSLPSVLSSFLSAACDALRRRPRDVGGAPHATAPDRVRRSALHHAVLRPRVRRALRRSRDAGCAQRRDEPRPCAAALPRQRERCERDVD